MTGPHPSGPAVVQADHHAFWIVDTAQLPGDAPQATNGLVTVTGRGAAVVITGIHTGAVSVTVDIRHAPPQTVGLAGWDEVVEVSLQSPDGHLKVASPQDELPELPELTPSGPGTYRLRVHARGRDTFPDGTTEEPVEDYLLMIWPQSEPTGETLLQTTDQYGAELRHTSPPHPPHPLAPRPEDPEHERSQRERTQLERRSRTRKP
ncbi:hypothetical protein ACWF94_08780 [Streptomyces sp. NPDC055078]